jgi:ABC-type bacteriocin/lantibiotic exporter with double-glycine peptidase domain
MKRNIFQKQDDSEITEPVEKKKEPESKTDANNEPPTDRITDNGLTDVINLVKINQVYSDSIPPNVVFKDFNLDIKDIKDQGQFITIMGKSGCGKSTLLRYISGLQEPTSGEVYLWEKTNKQGQDSHGFSTIYFL